MKITIQKPFKIILIFFLLCINISAQQSFSPEQFASDFDYMWSTLRDTYAYFDKKETDWNKVRELYRPMLADVKSRSDFVTLLEKVLDELYDNHTSLNTNLKTSSRLVPTGLDVWTEWRNGRAVITQLRKGFSAEQAGLRVGMEIVSINGVPVERASAQRLPKSLKAISVEARNWALRAVFAGTHDQPRIIVAKNQRGAAAAYRLDLPTHTTGDNYHYIPKVEWKMLPRGIGYIKINDLISTEIVLQFDTALSRVKASRGLILDIRDIPRGGNTDVAEPIMGRLIDHRMGYQEVVPLHEPKYIREVSPKGNWSYKAPIVVLVDGMKRATIVGTRMAGLNGGIFNHELPKTKIGVSYPGERLNQINGTPRENFVPPVLVDFMDRRWRRFNDPILAAGYSTLVRVIRRRQ